jgi:hypothetical protein
MYHPFSADPMKATPLEVHVECCLKSLPKHSALQLLMSEQETKSMSFCHQPDIIYQRKTI